jgi:hypothetical protein
MNISDLLKNPNKAKSLLEKALENEDKELAEVLIPLVKDPQLVYFYALKIAKGKIKDEWEDIIASDSTYSYWYSNNVLKRPFPKGEDAIAKDPYTAYNYARYILKDRFIKGEEAITNSFWVKEYVEFLKKINKLEEFLNDYPRFRTI